MDELQTGGVIGLERSSTKLIEIISGLHPHAWHYHPLLYTRFIPPTLHVGIGEHKERSMDRNANTALVRVQRLFMDELRLSCLRSAVTDLISVYWTQSQDALQACRGQQHAKSWWGGSLGLYKSKESKKSRNWYLHAYFWPGDVESCAIFLECFLSLGGIRHAWGTAARRKSHG